MKQLFILFLLILTGQAFAQQTSPYSRFGIGQQYQTDLANTRAMGSISTAFVDSVQSNISNPAALGARMFSSIDFGININYRNQKDQTSSTDFAEGGMSYLAYSFPVNKSRTWAMSLGAIPISYKNYSITSDVINDRYFREFDGEGNTYKLFLQNGFSVAKNLRIGLDAGIFFGSLEDKTYNTFLSSQANSVGQITQQKLRGYLFTLGGQYTTEVNDDLHLTFGSTYRLESSIDNEVTTEDFFYLVNSFDRDDNGKIKVLSRNEFGHTETVEDLETKLPQEISFGGYLNKKEKWSLGIDAKFANWENFVGINDNSTKQSYRNTYEFGLGGSFIPKFRNPTKAYESFEYRYGGHYSQSYLTIENTDIRDYGISIGVGLPVKRTIPGARIREIPSTIDVGIIIGQAGTLDNNLIQDNYIKGTIGLNLNDIWFVKKKYD